MITVLSNYLLNQFQIIIHFHLVSFYTTKYLQKTLKKTLGRENVIEQIIEFELRGPRSPSRTCNLKTGCFHDKTKISKSNIRVIIDC